MERMNKRKLTKQICRANVCDEKVGKADHISGILKKGQILSTRGRGTGKKILMDVNEAEAHHIMSPVCPRFQYWNNCLNSSETGSKIRQLLFLFPDESTIFCFDFSRRRLPFLFKRCPTPIVYGC
ncbi:hypothetical protein EVAR_5788_1 [Eumeta japonica]|uniref:Uncharacterized protein n=1 Tax=Eumeta variegata TaxID=151549 RepID=A0A4C1T4B3_EUMVA|nr:hypothetical protein EVAR_5788_1 [Eumeta japonica]